MPLSVVHKSLYVTASLRPIRLFVDPDTYCLRTSVSSSAFRFDLSFMSGHAQVKLQTSWAVVR